jgi:hypothetical protein
MSDVPSSLEHAIAQSRHAIKHAIAAGYTRLQVEILIPELKPMSVAQTLLMDYPISEWLPTPCKVFFADAGAGALARRDWPGTDFSIYGLLELKAEVMPDDQSFVMISPTPVDVQEVERLCNNAGDRPFILVNPRLEDVGTVGIGYTARQLRERFLKTFEPGYYLRPMDNVVLLRNYPTPWQVWLGDGTDFNLLAEEFFKPDSEALDRILRAAQPDRPTGQGLFAELKRILRALNQ